MKIVKLFDSYSRFTFGTQTSENMTNELQKGLVVLPVLKSRYMISFYSPQLVATVNTTKCTIENKMT